MTRRPYHTFQGFNLGFKDPTKWIHLPNHYFCPYCGGTAKQIGTATYEREVFTMWLCTHDDCAKICEGKEDARRYLYIRFDKAAKKDKLNKQPPGYPGGCSILFYSSLIPYGMFLCD